MAEQRRQKRVPVALRIKLRYPDVGAFIDKFASNLSRGGMFIASKSPKGVGTEIRFELKLADASTVVAGKGVVRWCREYDPDQPRALHGMGIEFTELAPESSAVLEQIIERRHQLGLEDDDGIPRDSRPRSPARQPPPPPPSEPEKATKPEPERAEKPAPEPAPEPEPAEQPEPAEAAPGGPRSAGGSDPDLDALLAASDDAAVERARSLARQALADTPEFGGLDKLLEVSATPAAASLEEARAELEQLLTGSPPPPAAPEAVPEPVVDEESLEIPIDFED